jgi:hypothetical protein
MPAKFQVGQKVRVVRIDDGITSRELIGFVGVVEEVEALCNGEYNYEVSGHYLNEYMLEAV